jgi:hypothetical protein
MDAALRRLNGNMKTLETLADDARLWIFAAERPLADGLRTQVEQEFDAFLAQWKSHGKPLTAAYAIVHDRFVAVAMIPDGDPSGCSVDKLYGLVKRIESATGSSLLDGDRIFYRDDSGEIASVSRAQFREMVKRGDAAADTPVFDLTIDRLGTFRKGEFEKRAAESWHAAAFGI